jgi:hypothetical protein
MGHWFFFCLENYFQPILTKNTLDTLINLYVALKKPKKIIMLDLPPRARRKKKNHLGETLLIK